MRKIALHIIMVLAAISCYAQTGDVADAFANAPKSVFPLLDSNTRLDMIDYFRNGLATPSQNALEGKSQITELTPEYMNVKMTDSSTAQLILLKDGRQYVVALINTVAAPGLDSNMKFYLYEDETWSQLDSKYKFSKPGWKEWLTPEGKAHQDEVEMQVPFMLVSYKYDPASKNLVLTNNLSKFLDKELYESISSYLMPQLVYAWNVTKFVLKK